MLVQRNTPCHLFLVHSVPPCLLLQLTQDQIILFFFLVWEKREWLTLEHLAISWMNKLWSLTGEMTPLLRTSALIARSFDENRGTAEWGKQTMQHSESLCHVFMYKSLEFCQSFTGAKNFCSVVIKNDYSVCLASSSVYLCYNKEGECLLMVRGPCSWHGPVVSVSFQQLMDCVWFARRQNTCS